MPKLKSIRGAVKRLKITKSGKIKRRKAFGNHLLTKKSSKRKRGLKSPTLVSRANLKGVRRLIPYL